MIVGVVREIKEEESRVALRPAGVGELRRRGHQVLVERGAGVASGFADAAYQAAGATLVDGPAAVYAGAALVVKVKEPQPQEYPMLRPGQVLFTFFHFAASESLTRAMLDAGITAVAYETVEHDDGRLPLLTPMSEVAGRMAVQQLAKYLEREYGGRGVLLGGVPGVAPATVVVLGAGTVGRNAALMAAGLGARVKLLDVNLERLRALAPLMPANVETLFSDQDTLRALLPRADGVVSCVLVHGARAPKLITREMLREMQPGSVVVDVAIDQGGSLESSRPTSHKNPIFREEGVIHYCVTNMPGALPMTATMALTNATLPYLLSLAGHGVSRAAAGDAAIARGVNMAGGRVSCAGVAEAFGLSCHPVAEVLADA